MNAAALDRRAPQALNAWLRSRPSLRAALAECDRADWAIFIAAALANNADAQRAVIRTASAVIGFAGEDASIWKTHFLWPNPDPLETASLWSQADWQSQIAANNLDGLEQTDYGFSDLLNAVICALVVAAPVELWLRHDPRALGIDLGGLRRELVSLPLFFLAIWAFRVVWRRLRVAAIIRRVRDCSFEAALDAIVPHLASSHERATPARRQLQMGAVRELGTWLNR